MFVNKSQYESLLDKVCEWVREICPWGSCLPREGSQIMFIVLGGFQGERAVNDGSCSPGKNVASKEDAWMWKVGRGRKKKGTQGWQHRTHREEGEKIVSWPWKKEINHAHAETNHTTHKSICISPHTTPTIKTDTGMHSNVYVKSQEITHKQTSVHMCK